MAHIALLRETGSHVTGICGSLEILEVAVHASCAREVVVSVGVALGALHVGVGTGKWPAGGGVVERRAGPVSRAVANFALLRESSRSVIGIGSSLIVLQVARDTCRAGQVEVPIRVTLFAL